MSTESSQTEKQREKKKRTDDLRTVEQLQKVYQITGILEGKKEKGIKEISETTIENFPTLMMDLKPQTQET